jgi:hypothetical protein
MQTYYFYNALTKQLTPAKRVIVRPDGSRIANPTAEQCAAIGAYVPADDPAPTPPEGKVAIPDGYELRDNAWHRVWRYEDAPEPQPRRWTRLSIKTALAQSEMLAAARTYLSATEIATGYSAWEALTDCDYIEEGYPNAARWSALLDGAAAALGKTRAEIDAFLDALPQG